MLFKLNAYTTNLACRGKEEATISLTREPPLLCCFLCSRLFAIRHCTLTHYPTILTALSLIFLTVSMICFCLELSKSLIKLCGRSNGGFMSTVGVSM